MKTAFRRVAWIVNAMVAIGGASFVSSATAADTPTEEECFFSWSEKSYPQYFAGTASTQVFETYRYRYYATTDVYLANETAQAGIWALSPRLNLPLTSMGTSAALFATAKAAGCSASPATPTNSCAQAAHFPDVSLRSNYIDWNDDGAAATITPSTAVSCSAGVVSVASNGVPNFDALGNGRGGANAAYQTNQKTWKFPANPVVAAKTTSLTHVLGAIGVLVNGVQFYTVTEGPQDNYANAVLNGFTNYCGGHVEQFHFHGYPACFFSKNTVGTNHTFLPDKTPGTVVGYAFDGFPVKTPYEACTGTANNCVDGVREIVSAYRYTGTKSYATEDASVYNVYEAGFEGSTLDACNGKTDASGNYSYYATKRYPYYLGCYVGTATNNR